MRSSFRFRNSFFVIFVLFCCNSSLFAQRGGLGWVWQNPLPQGNPLYSIHFAPDKETGLAVGSDGTILRTTDGGFIWQKRWSGTDVSLSGVYLRDKENAVVVGARGTILATSNGGKDWRPINSGV